MVFDSAEFTSLLPLVCLCVCSYCLTTASHVEDDRRRRPSWPITLPNLDSQPSWPKNQTHGPLFSKAIAPFDLHILPLVSVIISDLKAKPTTGFKRYRYVRKHIFSPNI